MLWSWSWGRVARPIASGALLEGVAIAEMIAALGIGLAIAWWISPLFLGVGLVVLLAPPIAH